MTSRRVLAFALLTQALLIGTAWACSTLLHIPPQWGEPRRDVLVGLAGAVVLACCNYALLVRAPANWLVDGVRAVYQEVLIPLFSRFDAFSAAIVGVAAGIGEEWLFRGVVQPTAGLIIASVLFGFAHVGGRSMVPFGVWASAMGLALGALAHFTGGLTAPIVAHGVYDILALAYIRRGVQPA